MAAHDEHSAIPAGATVWGRMSDNTATHRHVCTHLWEQACATGLGVCRTDDNYMQAA